MLIGSAWCSSPSRCPASTKRLAKPSSTTTTSSPWWAQSALCSTAWVRATAIILWRDAFILFTPCSNYSRMEEINCVIDQRCQGNFAESWQKSVYFYLGLNCDILSYYLAQKAEFTFIHKNVITVCLGRLFYGVVMDRTSYRVSMVLETLVLSSLVASLPLTQRYSPSLGWAGFAVWVWAIYFTFPGTYSTQPAVTTQVKAQHR